MPSRRASKPARATSPEPARRPAKPRRRGVPKSTADEPSPANARRRSIAKPPSVVPPKKAPWNGKLSNRTKTNGTSANGTSAKGTNPPTSDKPSSPRAVAAAAAEAKLAPARIRRALRASPFAWESDNSEAHFFALVARLPLTLEFVARLAPLVKPGSRSTTVVAYRVRVQIRGHVLVVRDAAPGSPVLGTVSLNEAALRFVKQGTIAIIPPVSPTSGTSPKPTITAREMPQPDAAIEPAVNAARPPRRWWRRRKRDASGQPGTPPAGKPPRVPLRPGFVLELDDHRRFPTVVEALSASVAVPHAPSLSRFEMVRSLRPSGVEPVFLVRDTRTGELLSMKLTRRCDIAASDAMRRVVDERAALERVRGHPFIIDLRHAFMTDTLVVHIFEHCRGGDLHHQLRLRKHGLREQEATTVIAQLVLAIEHVHRVGSAVYRDLKPENILLDAQGWVRLSGFGLCRILDAGIEASVARLRAGARKQGENSNGKVVNTSGAAAAAAADRTVKQLKNCGGLTPVPGIIRPASPLEDRPEKVRGRRDVEEAAAHAGKDVALGPTTSVLTDLNSATEEQPHSRTSRKPESSSTVTDWGSGGNFPDAPSPRAETLMESNGYRSPEMVGTDGCKATRYGRGADLWSLGVLAHYVMTGTFPFGNCEDDDVGLPQTPSPLSENPKVVLSPELPSREARSFVSGLLCADPKDRLGCGFEGFDEVRSHPWLRSIDWDDLARRDGAYQLKMLGDTHRAPAEEDEAADAARAVSAFSGATGILGLGNEHELLPVTPLRRSSRLSTSVAPIARRASVASHASISGRINPSRRASFSMAPADTMSFRAKLFPKRAAAAAASEISLAENIPGGHLPPSDGDVFGFCFSSTEQGFRPRRNSLAGAVQLPPVQPPLLSFGMSQRLSLPVASPFRRMSRMIDRDDAPPGPPPAPVANNGRRHSERMTPRNSIDMKPDAPMEMSNSRRASIERAKSGDFMPLDAVPDADIPFRKSLDMVAAGRRGDRTV